MDDGQAAARRRSLSRLARLLPLAMLLLLCAPLAYAAHLLTSGQNFSSHQLEFDLTLGTMGLVLAVFGLIDLARRDLGRGPSSSSQSQSAFQIGMGMVFWSQWFLPVVMHPSFVPIDLATGLLFFTLLAPTIGAALRQRAQRRRGGSPLNGWPGSAQSQASGAGGASVLTVAPGVEAPSGLTPQHAPTPPTAPTISRRTLLTGAAVVGFTEGTFVWFVRSVPSLFPSVTYRGHTDFVTALTWSLDSKRIASGDEKGIVRVWDAHTGADQLVYSRHSQRILSLVWSPDGSLVASSSEDGSVQWWRSDNGDFRFDFTSRSASSGGISWSPDSKQLAVAADSDGIQVVDAATAKILLTLFQGDAEIGNALWSPDGRYIAGRAYVGGLQLWDVGARNVTASINDLRDYALALAWSPDSKYIAYHSGGGVGISTASSGRDFATLLDDDAIEGISWSPDGRYLAAGGAESARVWELAARRVVFVWHGHFASIQALAWSPNGHYVASGGFDQTVQIWRP